MDLNELRNRAYKNACEHGFHEQEYSDDRYLMLVICELAEAVEADRKGKHASIYSFSSSMDAYIDTQASEKTRVNITEELFFLSVFEAYIKDSVEDELADTVIRLLDLAGLRGIDLSEVTVADTCLDMPFPIRIFNIVSELYNTPLEIAIDDVLFDIFSYCKYVKVDLLWHIEMKLKYNEIVMYGE